MFNLATSTLLTWHSRGANVEDARDLANLAFAFATLCQLKEDEPLKEALSEEVLKKLNWIQPQSLAFLTEVGLEASTHPFLLQKLNEILDHLVTALATREATSAWKRRVEAALQEMVSTDECELYLDHLGSVGSHLLLSRLQIDAPDQDFILRAMQSFPTCAGRTRGLDPRCFGLETQRPQQRRIFAYSEHRLQTTDATGGRDATAGRMLREHGFQGLRRWQKGWLKPLTLPVNHYVDRSVCAEFQVLNEICDLVNEEALADDMQSCALVEGVVQLLVSTAPCLSCISAALQFQLLFPKVHLQFGCVQPWSELPGGCEPFRSDEDLHAGAAAPSPPSPQQPAEAELSEAERADLSELCFRPEVQLSEGERQSLQSFIQRFDACAGLEATLQLLQREVHSFFGFQACKVLQRFTKKFGAAGSKERRTRSAARAALTDPKH
eukprot:g700.t1